MKTQTLASSVRTNPLMCSVKQALRELPSVWVGKDVESEGLVRVGG